MRKLNIKGFSLLELIVIIIIIGVVGSYVFQFTYSSTNMAARDVLMLSDRLKAEMVMERITTQYKILLAQSSSTFSLDPLGTYIKNNYAPADSYQISYVHFNTSSGAGSTAQSQADGGVMVVKITAGSHVVRSYFAE